MTKRYLSIVFPFLLTDWLCIRKPELHTHCVVFKAIQRNQVIITACNAHARAQGIAPGMPLADASAILPNMEVFDDKPGRDENLLKALGKWCIRFSPFVAIDAPNGLLLDISGCPHLWGGEQPYLQHILHKLQQGGYTCNLAIADTIGAAWACARYGNTPSIIAPAQQTNALLPLSPTALRLDQMLSNRLFKLGLYTIHSIIKIPRTALRRRFGEALLLKLEQALGTTPETIVPLVVTPPYHERLPCLEAIRTATGIGIAIEKLLEALCSRLKTEGIGLRTAVLKGYRVDGKTVQVTIGTSKSTHLIPHLQKLFALKIPQIEPALGIELFTLEATKTEPIPFAQEKLWQAKPGLEDQSLAELLDRIAGKMGQQAIRRYLPEAHYWPERSLRPALSLTEKTSTPWRKDCRRPILLLDRPEPVHVTAPVPDYPPLNFTYKGVLHEVAKADGPERIEREWWIDKGKHRDYYILEDSEGQRYWLFRSGHYNERGAAWFIHGFFA